MAFPDLATRPLTRPPAVDQARSATPAEAPPATARARRGVSPTAVLALVWSGAALVLAQWWLTTASVTGAAGWLTEAGRVTGLLAGYGAALLVLLMARIPSVERGAGADRLARWHAMGGRYTVSLALAHAALITLGYAAATNSALLAQVGSFLTSYPDLLTATAALALFVALAATSARAARRRLPYEAWHLMHLSAYLAVYLGFGHQIANGAQFVADPVARWAWTGLYAAAGLAALWFRFATPLVQSWTHDLRVARVVREGPDTVSVIVSGRHLDRLGAESGQFFRWRFLTGPLVWSANPYSLSAPPTANLLRFTAKDLGAHSRALAALKPGTRVIAEGPYGAMTAARLRRDRVLLVAGGVGITPMRALLESLPARPGEITLVYRASSECDLILRRELDALAAARGARVHYVIGRRRALGGDPLGGPALERLVPDLRRHEVFVCGPDGLRETVVAACRRARVPRRRIHSEDFAF
jgi:predicted ferric reductase